MLDSLSGQRPRYIIPALGRLYASLSDFAWFVGGTLLAIGLLTRPAAAAVFIFMMVAVFSTHLPNGFFWIEITETAAERRYGT